jgi:hypothetical protein
LYAVEYYVNIALCYSIASHLILSYLILYFTPPPSFSLEPNRKKLGESGACDLVLKAFQNHSKSAPVLCKAALALDVLSREDDANKNKFAAGGAADHLLDALLMHDKHAPVVADSIRALITLSTNKECKAKASSEEGIRVSTLDLYCAIFSRLLIKPLISTKNPFEY